MRISYIHIKRYRNIHMYVHCEIYTLKITYQEENKSWPILRMYQTTRKSISLQLEKQFLYNNAAKHKNVYGTMTKKLK